MLLSASSSCRGLSSMPSKCCSLFPLLDLRLDPSPQSVPDATGAPAPASSCRHPPRRDLAVSGLSPPTPAAWAPMTRAGPVSRQRGLAGRTHSSAPPPPTPGRASCFGRSACCFGRSSPVEGGAGELGGLRGARLPRVRLQEPERHAPPARGGRQREEELPRHETCPISTGGKTRRVQLVRDEGRDVSSYRRGRGGGGGARRARSGRGPARGRAGGGRAGARVEGHRGAGSDEREAQGALGGEHGAKVRGGPV